MKNYAHVLLTTDFRPDCKKVAERALEIVGHYGAILSLVHVLETTPVVYGAGEFALPFENTIEIELLKEARERVAVEAKELKIPPDRAHVLLGSTAAEIVHLAKEKTIDLIVIGGHHTAGLRLLFGSTANSVLHSMPCDILAVRLER